MKLSNSRSALFELAAIIAERFSGCSITEYSVATTSENINLNGRYIGPYLYVGYLQTQALVVGFLEGSKNMNEKVSFPNTEGMPKLAIFSALLLDGSNPVNFVGYRLHSDELAVLMKAQAM